MSQSSTAYARGRQFEYRCRDYFKSLGYLVCRSPQSRSPYDLIVVGSRFVLLVQCKVGGQLGPAAWNELYDLGEKVNAIAVLATREGSKHTLKLYHMIQRKDDAGRRSPKSLFALEPNAPDSPMPERTMRVGKGRALAVV
jgi:Holliday junction resolvase